MLEPGENHGTQLKSTSFLLTRQIFLKFTQGRGLQKDSLVSKECYYMKFTQNAPCCPHVEETVSQIP
jgi:hypothetical protein